ncbi:MAG TPA: RIP metalloprotease RseP [Candidatus Limnocylindrales bacterium]|nr:RIP metalloprotease RseP [Candidatus Limnocylindrales bacterium]
MSHTWVGIVAAIVGLGIMVFVHEWGHFVAARLCGVRVDVFSLGYGNRIFGWRRGNTDYRVSVFPLGGYVKMAGDNPAEERTGDPDEFLAKSRWRRLFIIVAGPFMNFVLAFALLWGLYMVGVPVPRYTAQPVQVAGVIPKSPAEKAGIEAGDKIVAIDGTKVSNWDQALSVPSIVPGRQISVDVERGATTIPVTMTVPKNLTDGFDLLGCPKQRVQVDTVTPGEPAAKAGVKPGDQLISANGQTLVNRDVLIAIVKQSDGKPLNLGVRRDGKEFAVTMKPIFGDPGNGLGKRWMVGFSFSPGETVRESYSFLAAAGQSWTKNVTIAKEILSVVGGLFSGRVSIKDLAGPVGIVRVSVQAAKMGFAEYIIFMAFLSVNLGILNLLPIPILDGGHVLMLAIEGSLRRDLSIAVKERFVTVGLVFLLAVFGFVMYFDVMRLFPHH